MIEAAARVDPRSAREQVRAILRGGTFRPKNPPQPLKGLLEHIGSAFETVFGPIGRFFERMFSGIPAPLGWLLLLAALITGIVWLATATQRRATIESEASDVQARADDVTLSPDELERLADEAERAGDCSLALRLRFRAGLLRLDRDAHAIRLRPGLTTREVRDALHSARFDDLADTFEQVAYAGRSAEPRELEWARDEWPDVVRESRRG